MQTTDYPALGALPQPRAAARHDLARLLTRSYLAFALVAVSLGAFLHVLLPLDGDQSVFSMAGQTILSGGTLYVDYWDVKQPGIFYFFAAAGALFGFTSWGVHVFELIYWAFVSVAIWRLARPLLANGWLASSIPLVFLATYFGHGHAWHATQVEALAAGPLAIALLLVCRALSGAPRPGLLYFLAGLCAGVTFAFKLAMAPVYLALFASVWVHLYFVQGLRSPRPYLVSCLAVAAGTAAVLAPVIAGFVAAGTFHELYFITFQLPRAVIEEGIPDSIGYIRVAAGLIYMAFALAALAAVIGLHALLDRGRKPLLYILTVVVALGGLVSIGLQIYSLWEYHFQLLFMPAAILFVLALDRFLAARSAGGRDLRETATIAVVALLGTVLAAQVASADWRPAYVFAKHVVARGDSYDRFLAEAFPRMAGLQRIAEASGGTRPGEPIYVFGDPTLYHVMDATQAVPVPGWYWELMPGALLDETAGDLERARPRLIFIDSTYHELAFGNSAAMRDLLTKRYRPASALESGRWYVLSDTSG